MRDGYLSFDIIEVKKLSESDSPNAEAYGYLYQAVTTQAGTDKGIDDIYPETALETEQMRALVDKARKARVDMSDQYLKTRYVWMNWTRFWTGPPQGTGTSSGR